MVLKIYFTTVTVYIEYYVTVSLCKLVITRDEMLKSHNLIGCLNRYSE